MGTTAGPLDEGFHYYNVNIDGGKFNDPGSLNFYGSVRWDSGIEIPAHDQDFYALKDVPHGNFVQILFPSKSTDTLRRAFVSSILRPEPWVITAKNSATWPGIF